MKEIFDFPILDGILLKIVRTDTLCIAEHSKKKAPSHLIALINTFLKDPKHWKIINTDNSRIARLWKMLRSRIVCALCFV